MIILYYSKHGFTEKCAQLLAEHLGEDVRIQDVRKTPQWSANPGEMVILGFPVYMGSLPGPVKEFLQHQEKKLLMNPLGIFISALSSRRTAQSYFTTLVPPLLQDHAQFKGFFGGALEWKNLNPFERVILKTVKGMQGDVSNLNLEEIQKAAEELQKLVPGGRPEVI